MNANYIPIANGELCVQVTPTSSNGVVNKKKEISLIILDVETNRCEDFVSTLTPQQALEIASQLINAVLEDKKVTEEEAREHIRIINRDKTDAGNSEPLF